MFVCSCFRFLFFFVLKNRIFIYIVLYISVMVSFNAVLWQINSSHVVTVPFSFVDSGLLIKGKLYKVTLEEVLDGDAS